MNAAFSGQVIAVSGGIILIQGNHSFPTDSVMTDWLSTNGDTCERSWKRHADYFDVTVEGQTAKGSAWSYPAPKPVTAEIGRRFAFWRDVTISEE